ncbi:hypothetical protein [Streptomyces sp. NPDC059916]|uniref:hypothetical protein n=1 Tax=Streptomyces sp. NPDC059916 TaxID=3347001 RepID=UPI00367C61D4
MTTDEPTPEDGETAPVAKTRKRRVMKRVLIGIGVAAVLLIKFARAQDVTENVEPDEWPMGRPPTPEELEFAEIVKAAAEGAYRLMSYSTYAFSVDARFRSNSGRGSWNAYLTFDPETGHFEYSQPYSSANAAVSFGEKIGRRIREARGIVDD